LVEAALYDVDEMSARQAAGKRLNQSDAERLRNHVRKLCKALSSLAQPLPREGELVTGLLCLREAARHPKDPTGWKVHNEHFLHWLAENMGPENIAYLRALISSADRIAAAAPPSADRSEVEATLQARLDEAETRLDECAYACSQVKRFAKEPIAPAQYWVIPPSIVSMADDDLSKG
jgi:hypothetical protein